MQRSHRLASSLALLLALGCASREQVVRIEGDQIRVGRVVSGTAYAWYLRGQWYEKSGKLPEAEYCYQQGSNVDARSGALYGALGRVRCLLGDPKTDGTFSEGKSRADEKLPILLEESACATRKGRTGVAIRSARDALELAPADERPSRALFSALRASRDSGAAESVLRGFRLYSGQALGRSVQKLAREHEFPSLPEARGNVDRAIRAGDLTKAQNAGAGVVGSGEVALRAALLGKPELALEQARQTLILDPTDFDAHVAELIAHSQLPSPPPLLETGSPGPLSELGVLSLGLSVALYDELAGRQLAAAAPETDGSDPLARELRRRLARLTPELVPVAP